MLSIEGVQISPDHWEITIYGWYVTLRQSSENNLWNATIQSLVEQMPIISSGDYINLLEAKGWCIEEILRQWKKSFQQWRKNPSVEDCALYKNLFERLSQYNTQTASALIWWIVQFWGTPLLKERETHNVLSRAELTLVEPNIMFWLLLNFFPVDFTKSQNNKKPDSKHLDLHQTKQLAEQMANELAKLPFYRAINVFNQVSVDWLQVFDLSDLMNDGDDQKKVTQKFLRIFEIN